MMRLTTLLLHFLILLLPSLVMMSSHRPQVVPHLRVEVSHLPHLQKECFLTQDLRESPGRVLDWTLLYGTSLA